MEFRLQTARMLHDEHMEEVARLERLEGVLQRHGPGDPPDANDSAMALLLRDLIAGLESQTDRHFSFEEEHLFPRLADMGEADIGQFLAEEHEAIREIAVVVTGIARQAQRDGFIQDSWGEFRHLGLELVERVVTHIQKEEMALLPMIEQLIDGEQDSQLASAYMADR